MPRPHDHQKVRHVEPKWTRSITHRGSGLQRE